MKIDLRYVDREIAMCMCITHQGAERLAIAAQMARDGKPYEGTAIEMMLSIENEFIRAEAGGITSWVAAIEKYRKEKHLQEIEAENIQASLLWLFGNDLVGLHLVVL